MHIDEDIKALTYDVSHILNKKGEEETEADKEEAHRDEDEIDQEEEGEKYKEGDEETQEDVKEEIDKRDEDKEGEEKGKGKGKKRNGEEEAEEREESPRVSLEPTEREETTTLTALNTPIKKRKMIEKTPLYFKTRKSIRIWQGKPKNPTKVPVRVGPYSPPSEIFSLLHIIFRFLIHSTSLHFARGMPLTDEGVQLSCVSSCLSLQGQ